LGLVSILLSITGLLHFFFPKLIRRKKRKEKEVASHLPSQPQSPEGASPHTVASLLKLKKKNLRWHNVLGYVFVLFLIINTISGMHLRPPLLIPIANSKVGIIPNTHMDSPNPWFDKLRRVHWDEEANRYIFSTSEGLFFANETLSEKLIYAPSQPPVSIMGCNVFKALGNQNYLVGSFSGMFVWNAQTGSVQDFFTRQSYAAPPGMTRPIAANMATGFVEGKESAFCFDFNGGAIALNGKEFPEMSTEIREKSQMSLWNVALELHTGRIFENLVGLFYILYVPIAGICILLVLISGFMIWWLAFRRKRRTEGNQGLKD
jgi:4-amino-4-deoxy-L-arabinose transferase-like glycosyltransferase